MKYTNKKRKAEIKTLVTANLFSIVYYNSENWHLPTLSPQLKQTLLSASANALKLCLHNPDPMTSFVTIHYMAGRATLGQYMHLLTRSFTSQSFNSHTPILD